MRNPKVALVHDYLVIRGGAERALLALTKIFPDAPIYTSFYRPETTLPAFAQLDVRPLWSDRLPGDAQSYRTWIMAFALAFEGLRLRGVDLVISNSSGFAKSAGADAGLRFAWCQTPPRFLWPTGGSGEPPSRLEAVARLGLGPLLRCLDVRAAKRVDLFAANSANVRDRIARFYGQESRILYPPIDTGLFRPIVSATAREDFFLLVGRLVRYKRFDAVIETFNRLGRRLVICGAGPDLARLETIAGPTVRFAGHVPDEDLVGLYSRARAVIVPGEEDWGMVGLEANACGCPAVAAAWGGSVESVRDGVTGILYDPGQPDGLVDAIGRLETTSFHPTVLREHAGNYGEDRFRDRVSEIIDPILQGGGAVR